MRTPEYRILKAAGVVATKESHRLLQQLGQETGGDDSTGRHVYLLFLVFMALLILICCVLALSTLRGSRSDNESIARLERMMRNISANSVWSIAYYGEGSTRLHILSSFKMSVDESHFRRIQLEQGEAVDDSIVGESSGRASSNDDETKDTLFITLPLPGCQKVDGDVEMSGSRLVSAVCAVCLVEYAVGDEITWSSNCKCPHAFHAECMTEYVKRKRDVAPCPMCRRDFLAKEEVRTVVAEPTTSDEQVSASSGSSAP